MKEPKQELEFGLKAKMDQLNDLKKELKFLDRYEMYIKIDIDLIEYNILRGDSFFGPRLLEIRKAELEKVRGDIKSQKIVIDYFHNDIKFYFKLNGNTKRLTNN